MGLFRYLSVVVAFLAILWAAFLLNAGPEPDETWLSTLPDGPDPETRTVLDTALLDQAVYCPVQADSAKETVLLVHGTGMTPEINWEHTLVPPLVQAGFQPCYVAVPGRLFHDTQTSAEYVSHAIKKLAADSGGDISIVSWSAGSLVTQWTLTFYPASRVHVRRHVALGPSYRGSWAMVPLFYLGLYSEAVVQQLPWSAFLAALRRAGGLAATVPTTSIGSSSDQIVQPGFLGDGHGRGWGWDWSRIGRRARVYLRDTWRLDPGPRASNVDVFKVCAAKLVRAGAPPRLFMHEALLWEPASHAVLFAALRDEDTRLGAADAVTLEDCRGRTPAPGLGGGDAEARARARIMPELFGFAPSVPTAGWPEVALREYANVSVAARGLDARADGDAVAATLLGNKGGLAV